MKVIIKFISILLIIFLLSLSGCISNDNEDKDEYKNNMSFYLEIKTSVNSKYEIIVPIPVDNNGPIEFLNYLKITQGNGSFEITQIEPISDMIHPIGLKIVSSHSIIIEGKHEFIADKHDAYGLGTISMAETPTQGIDTIFCFCNKSNENQSVIIKSYRVIDDDTYPSGSNRFGWEFTEKDIYLENGWQKLGIKFIESSEIE